MECMSFVINKEFYVGDLSIIIVHTNFVRG